jgi:hypothetical protein
MKSNNTAATITAFRDNWDSDVQVNVGTKVVYRNDSNGSYSLEIMEAGHSDVTCKVLQSKNNTCPTGQVIIIDDIEMVIDFDAFFLHYHARPQSRPSYHFLCLVF